MKIDLTSVTLVTISCNRIEETCKAIECCLWECRFGDVTFFSNVRTPFPTVLIPELKTIGEYSQFVLKDLPHHPFATDFVLLVQWDGFVVRPRAWTNKFFDFDYVGAPWPWLNSVGNGGFSLRSCELLDAQREVFSTMSSETLQEPEDRVICFSFRNEFESKGIRFADVATGYHFATEHGNYDDHKSFGFHGFGESNAKWRW